MLNALREGSKHSFVLKFIVFGFLLMGLGGLVFMDIGGFFRGGLGGTTLALIGDEQINIYEFQNEANRAVRAQNMTMEEAHQLGFTDMILNARIGQILVRQTADELGLEISKEQVEQTLARVIDTYRQDGQTRKETLQALLTSQNMTQDMLIEQTKVQLKNSLIRNALAAPTLLIPDVTAEAIKTFQKEQRDIELFKLAPNQVEFNQEPTEEELKTLYEREKDRFAIPEMRTLEMIKISSEQFEGQANITEEELREIYNERAEEYATSERRYLKQAIVPDLETAAQILEAAEKEGTSLKAATKSVTGSIGAYRAETFFNKDGLLDALADPVFDAEETGFLELRQSALGWHVIELTKIEAPRQQDFAEVKDDIRDEALQIRTDDLLIDLLERAEDRLASGDNIQQIADNVGLEVITITDLENSVDSSMMKLSEHNIPETELLLNEAFAMDQNTVSDPIEIDLDGFVMIEVTGVKPLSYESFDKVKAQVKDLWLAEERAKALRQKAASLALIINSDQTRSMSDIAKELGTRIRSFKGIERNGDLPSGLHGEVVNRAFAIPAINQAQQLKDPDGEGYIIFNVTASDVPADVTSDDEPLAVQKLQIVKPLESTTQEMYYRYLYDSRDVEVNEGLMDVIFGKRERPMGNNAAL